MDKGKRQQHKREKDLYKSVQNKHESPFMACTPNDLNHTIEITSMIQEKYSGGVSKCWCEKESPRLYCSICKNVIYCSKGHQKKDWKKHKEVCIFLKEDYLFAPILLSMNGGVSYAQITSNYKMQKTEILSTNLIYKLLNCKLVEPLKVGVDAYLLIDENGRAKNLKENPLASLLFGSSIFGDALLVKIAMVENINFTLMQVKDELEMQTRDQNIIINP